jgi:hypothetical protein
MAEYRLSTLNRPNQQSNRSPNDGLQGRFVNRPCAPRFFVLPSEVRLTLSNLANTSRPALESHIELC